MKKIHRFMVLILVMVFILGCIPTAATAPKTDQPIIADWIWNADLDHRGAETVMKEHSEAGFTDVYLLCKGTRGTLSWDTACDEAVKEYDYDLLADALKAANRYGIRLHAWITVGRDDHYISTHPKSNFYHFKYGYKSKLNCFCLGKDAESTCSLHPDAYVDLRNEAYLQYMERLVKELCLKYPTLAGIQLDTIRYGTLSYDWGTKTVSAINSLEYTEAKILRGEYNSTVKSLCVQQNYKYGKDDNGYLVYSTKGTVSKGVTATGASFKNALLGKSGTSEAMAGVAKIRDLRVNTVNECIRRIKAVMDEHAPQMLLTADIMPEVATSPYSQAVYGQDPVEMSKLVDYLCIMSYSTEYGQSKSWPANCAKALAKQGCKVLAGIQFYDSGEKESEGPSSIRIYDEICQIKDAQQAYSNILGYAAFRHGCGVYAGAYVDDAEKVLRIKIHNPIFNKENPNAAYPVVKLVIDLKNGAKAVKVAEEWKNCNYSIQENGTRVVITGKFLGGMGSKNITIFYKGDIDPTTEACCIRSFAKSGGQYPTLCNTIFPK